MRAVLLALIAVVAVSGRSIAATAHSNSVSINATAPSTTFGDFYFNWRGYDSQTVYFWFTGETLTTNDTASFRMQKQASGATNITYLIKTNGFTITTNSVTFSLSVTNIPPDGTYKAELQLNDGTTYRSYAKGQVQVVQSLYRDDGLTWTNSGSVYVSLADANYLAALTNITATAPLSVSGTGRTRALTYSTNATPTSGTLNGTNGVYWTRNTTNYWLLFP